MTLMMLLDMALSTVATRLAVGERASGITYRQLHDRAGAGAELLRSRTARHLAYIGPSELAFPVGLFASAWAGIPFIPLNYRLGRDQISGLLERHEDVLVVADDGARRLIQGTKAQVLTLDEWSSATSRTASPEASETDGEDIAALLYTSGTTAAPKAVVLRHRHLTSYVISSVDFASAAEADATLVSVPPYHVAGLATAVSNVYASRRIVYLPAFSPRSWFDTVRDEGITHAMVVPTMLARIVDHLGEGVVADTPSLRSLAYGGARMPAALLERALAAFQTTDFVNAYGLTETSSTIAVLGPDDHRAAFASDRPEDRRHLSSVGRLVPGVEAEVRDEHCHAVGAGVPGEIWVRGAQVSGEYVGLRASLDAEGWFPTRDRGSIDDDGYLYVDGRTDDTIIRGGENIAPAEIEDVLLDHPLVSQAAVVGLPDDEWGQRIAAAVVLTEGAALTADDLRAWARATLRSAKTPEVIAFRHELPFTETGKLLRRAVVADLADVAGVKSI